MHKRKSLNNEVFLLFMNLFNYDGQIKFLCVCGWASDKQYHDIEGLEFHRVLASHFQYSYKEIVDIHGSIDGVGMWWGSGVPPPFPRRKFKFIKFTK